MRAMNDSQTLDVPAPAAAEAQGGHRAVNSTVLVMLGILGIAVVASIAAGTFAALSADPELPAQYHWEGEQYDRDVDRAHHARELEVRGLLAIGAGGCRISLSMRGAAPQALSLTLTHIVDPALDRRITLARRGSGYEAPCSALPPQRYHLTLTDAARSWSVRREIDGRETALELDAGRQ